MGNPTIGSNVDVFSCYPETAHSEDALLEALRQGDLRAFEVTFHTYKSLVYNLSYRILLDREDALDVSQEVFLTLFQKIAHFRGDCSLKSWIFRITFNKSLNKKKWWRRRGKFRTEPLSLLHGERIKTRDNERPDTTLQCQEMEELVRGSLEKLPLAQRAVILLRDLQGCSYEEIAEITGASVGTVKSRIARARAAVQHTLKASDLGRIL
ncbi:MAG TPA: sigma-70 family RNA polymerase sigma factor [Acidobacteriota bacterium]|jgi:RNA polymerase sigma-70 factor (ECF subfamily)|nr:sigma-70 family RNA polymerase sigma factor [Acidobacteriota bacterium]